MANVITFSPGYYPSPIIGRPLALAYIYVGEPDTDPEIAINQKQVSALQEDTTIVPITQPIRTNAGGVPTYNGSPVTLLVEGAYSLKVLNMLGVQRYYIPRNSEDSNNTITVDTIAELRTVTGGSFSGTSAHVLGYTTIGDGGGGPLRVWLDGQPAGTYIDNNGSVIVPSGGDGSGAWLFSESSNANSAWFGGTVTLYVSTTGLDTNSGYTSGSPFATLQKAFDVLETFGPTLNGTWSIELAAGTWTGSAAINQSLTTLSSESRLTIYGPDVSGAPNVPTAIFDGTGGTDYEHGVRVGGIGMRAMVQDIKFINYTATNNRIGLVGENEIDLATSNIHADNCDWCGIYAFSTVRARLSGGIYNNCRSGIIVNDTQATVGGVVGTPMQITNCTESGLYWSRGSQGHSDYITFEDNAVGVLVAENSRVDTILNIFNTNTVGILAQTGGVYGEGGSPNQFGTGVDANGTNIIYRAFSGDTSELRVADSWIRVAVDRITRTHTGTAPFTLSTPYTIPAYRLDGAGKSCRVTAYGSFTQVTGGSIVDIVFGGMTLSLTVPAAASNVSIMLEGILNEGGGGYRSFGKIEQGLNAERVIGSASGFDETIDQTIEINTTMTNAGDSISINRVDVELIG